MTRRQAGMTRRDPDAASHRPDPLLVRVILGLYPRRWRDRYGQEFAVLLTDLAAGSPWHARAAQIASAASGALDARLNPLGGRTMTDRIRRSITAVACAVVVFTIAGAGFQKMTEYPDFHEAARAHAAIGASFDILRAAAILAGITVLAGALPLAWIVARQAVVGRRADLIRLLLVPPAAVIGWLAIAKIVASLYSHPQARSTANTATLAAIALLGIAAAAACVWAVAAILRRADLAPRLLRPQVVPMAVLTMCMAVVTGADISWGLAVRAADSPLFYSNNGLVSTSVPPNWAGGVVALAAATVVTAAATVRAARELRTPAQPALGEAAR
jgi:hypothetical protein